MNTDHATATATAVDVLAARNDKRERKHTARALPPGLTHNQMKKYVVYYRETVYLKNGKQQPREYFKVESHPRLTKAWVSSKSTKIPLLEKLAQANQLVESLDEVNPDTPADTDNNNNNNNNNIIERWNKMMPKYTSLRIVKDTPESITMSLVYDRKDNHNGFRWTGSHTFTVCKNDTPADINVAVSLEMVHLQNKLREKYAVDVLVL